MRAASIEREAAGLSHVAKRGRPASYLGAGLAVWLCYLPAIAQSPVVPAEASVQVDTATRNILRGALKYLAREQHLDGSWSMKEGPGGQPIAITGYTLLAFLAMGNLPDEGEYAKNVTAGVQYLLDSIQPDGLFRDASRGQYMYNHGIATVALAEIFGETRNPALRPKLERLIDVILKAQAPEGGWRYTPQPKDSDLSVTVLQVAALRAAQNAGFSIPEEAIARAVAYVKSCFVQTTGGFAYMPGRDQGAFARTAAAIYSLQVLGHYDDPSIPPAVTYMLAHAKEATYFSYGHYYAAPAMYMIGGDHWRQYYSDMRQLLLAKVTQEGDVAHWEPVLESHKELNAAYCTPVYVHVLAMPYHFLPLYQR